MSDTLPAGDAPASGAEVQAAPQSDSPAVVIDSTKSTETDTAVVTVEEKPGRPVLEEAKSGFLSSISGLLTGKPATTAPPQSPTPLGQTVEDENAKTPDIPAKSPYELQIYPAEHLAIPSVDIIAVHDLGETSKDAWTDGIVALPKSTEPTNGNDTPKPKDVTASELGQTATDAPKGKSNEPINSGLKVPEVVDHDPVKARMARKLRKETAQIWSTEGSARPSMETERQPQKEINWLRDLLTDDIPRSRILAFSYPKPGSEKPFSWELYVENTAKQLIQQILGARAHESNKSVPMVLIGYGFGGVIIQKAVELVRTSGAVVGHENAGPTKADPASNPATEKASGTQPFPGDQTANEAVLAKHIYQILLLDTPFPDKDDYFPANTNVRMCSILQEIEDKEKDSRVLDDVWKGFVKAYRVASGEAIDVTWMHSQAKGKQLDINESDLVNDKLAPSKKINITLTSVSMFQKHRRLAIIPGEQDYIYHAIRSRIQSTLLFQGIYLRNADIVFTVLENKNIQVIEDIEGKLTPLHAAAQMDPPMEDIVTQLVNQRQQDILKRDDEGRVPLHHALLTAWLSEPAEGETRSEFANTIRYLLRNMQRIDFDIKDKNGESPWDLLRCNNKIPHCVCDGDNCAADWIRELRETLEPIGGPVIQEAVESFAKLSPPAPGSAQYDACTKTDGTVGEFYHAHNEKNELTEYINLKTPTIYRMIYDPKQGCARILQVSRRRQTSQEFKCRWIHIPANNEQWISDLFLSLGIQDDSMNDYRLDGLSVFNRHTSPHAIKYEVAAPKAPKAPQVQADGSHLPTITEETPAESSRLGRNSVDYGSWESLSRVPHMTGSKTVAVFMPILAYECHEEWKSIFDCIMHESGLRLPGSVSARDGRPSSSDSAQSNKDSLLLRGYLYPGEGVKPLHSRRTLDQYSYYMLKSTERRDRDQVVYRWVDKKRKEGDIPSTTPTPILMVDQLWLWVLPDGTVVTSLPNTHKPSERYNIRKLLSEEIESNKKRRAIQAPENLVAAVLKICLSIMTREGPGGVKLQECFQSSINEIAEKQAVAMEVFLDTVDRLQAAPDPFKLTGLIDSFSRISDESRQLVEIVDIQDELEIIKSVLNTQKKVLEQLKGVLSPDRPSSTAANTRGASTSPPTDSSDPPKSPSNTAFKSGKVVDQALRIVKENIARVEEMSNSARRIPDGLKQLLDFKQQQASGWEARYAKKLSEQGKRQNTIMVIFTVVTIIFLPMSFIASFMAIGIREFPKEQGSDETDWPIRTASSLLFGISVGVSVLILVGVSLWFRRISHRRKKRMSRQPHALKGASSGISTGPAQVDVEKSATTGWGPRRAQRRQSGLEMATSHAKKTHGSEDAEYSDSEDMGDDDREYSHLFGRWDWHTHIPGVRRLWEWKLYKVRREYWHTLRHSREVYEWDYPLNRWRRRLSNSLQLGERARAARRAQARRKRRADLGSDCGSEDERARNNELGDEHRERVMGRKEEFWRGVGKAVGWLLPESETRTGRHRDWFGDGGGSTAGSSSSSYFTNSTSSSDGSSSENVTIAETRSIRERARSVISIGTIPGLGRTRGEGMAEERYHIPRFGRRRRLVDEERGEVTVPE